ncbi:MAG TPA: GIY-YIG nuclease family protein [Candidatus Saccharimonadia bacterium]
MASELIRAAHTDAQWRAALYDFMYQAKGRGVGILIDYVYEPPNLVVPQRLYNYALHPDYVARRRDDFEFGFDLITAARTIPPHRTYGVYVVQLNDSSNHLYVGQTWYDPEERLAQHNTGLAVFHAARPFKHGLRGRLRPDLYAHLPRYTSPAPAEALEAKTARDLRAAGYRVEGGH